MLEKLKVGDIIYEAMGSWGVTGHSAMVEGRYWSSKYQKYYIRLIEAIGEGVCYGVLDDTRVDERKATVYRLRENAGGYSSSTLQKKVRTAVDFAISQKGKPYVISANKSSSANNENWYCSELVWAAYVRQGIDLNSDGGVFVTPRDIASSDWLTSILKYKLSYK